METAVGNGCLAITTVERDGRIGILLEQTCEPHDINGPVPDAKGQPGCTFIPGEKDVIIWIDGLEGARVLQDMLNMLCLKLGGYDVGI
jgi:hypothetical protein